MRFAAPRTSPAEPVEALDRAAEAMARASAEALGVVIEVDRRKLWRRDGATSMTSWLAGRYGLAWGTAREWVRVAHALGVLPRIERAYAEGRLSWDQLRPLTRFVTPESDERWAERAPELRPAWLWREARRHEQVRAREAEETRRARYLSLDWDHERSVLWLEGMLPAEEGTALQTAIQGRAEAIPADPGAVDPSGARLADALVDLATAGPQPAMVVVHAGAEALAGPEPKRGPWLAETEGGQRLTPEAVRRLACDGRIEWGAGVGGPAGGDRPARTSGPGPAPPGAPAPGWSGVPVPGMRAEAVAPRPPPGPLGGRRGHQPRQPGAAVPRAPPPDSRGRLADQRASGQGAPVPRSGRPPSQNNAGGGGSGDARAAPYLTRTGSPSRPSNQADRPEGGP